MVRLLCRVGVFSYAIYLWHVTAIGGLTKVTDRTVGTWLGDGQLGWVVSTTIICVGVIAVGIIAAYAVERPVLRIRDRIAPSRALVAPRRAASDAVPLNPLTVDGERASTTCYRHTMTGVGGEVRLGSMLFTLVEPHRGHEVAYNRWYERDHFYAGCMVGPWLFAGRRFVATRALKDLRFGTDVDRFGGVDLGTYLAIYWILEGRHEEHTDWALRQVQWLHAHGRMFAQRDHVHTLMYRHSVHRVHAVCRRSSRSTIPSPV